MESELGIVNSLIPKCFDLRDKEIVLLAGVSENRAEMEAFLSARIRQMLKDEMEALVNAMYRIDVPEAAFHEAMTHVDRAERLAGLVVDRLIQKAKTRIWYRDNS